MPRIVLSLEEWRAVAHELAATHTSPPRRDSRNGCGSCSRRRTTAGLSKRSPWSSTKGALRLSALSTELLTGTDPNAGQRSASVAEADAIIRDHQRRS